MSELIGWMKRHRRVFSIVVTAVCCLIAYFASFLLRFDFGAVPQSHRTSMWLGVPILLTLQLLSLLFFRTYRGLYRYVSLYDVVQLVKALTLSTLSFAVIWMALIGPHHVMPRSIYLLDWMLSIGVLVGLRILVRLWAKWSRGEVKPADSAGARRALVIGAGRFGSSLIRMIDRRFLGRDYDVVGFVDDDPIKLGNTVHGVSVLGTLKSVPALVKKLGVHVIIFAIEEPDSKLLTRVVTSCEGLKVRFFSPSVSRDAESGELSVGRMRDLNIHDLLGRKPVQVDELPVREAVVGRTILVTGAGGSIGSELCRQIVSFNPARLVLLDMGESALFEIDRELRARWPEAELVAVIGDIKHADVVERVFADYKPEYVYHAAAYKHVPLMEGHPDEAVLNNVRGTRQLAEAARRHGCQRFVMISTDKAVRPSNVMGATKRMCELVIQSMNGGDTVFAAVRFGNVLGSNGSVIPIFRKQMDAGGPLTVTHADMTRFFMTIPEAVSLVLQCGVIAQPSDVFVLDMGTPVRIMDLARNMIRLSGLKEGVDISIKVTGLRPGEKMYEELVAYGEEFGPTSVPKVNVLQQQQAHLAFDVLAVMIRRLEGLAAARRSDEVRELLWRLIELDNERTRDQSTGLTHRSIRELAQHWEGLLAPVPSVVPQGSGRVLGVLRHMKLAPVLESVLIRAGFELECVDSFDVAATRLNAASHDLVLCDYVWQSGTVLDFQELLNARGVRIPVIPMSMYDTDKLGAVLGTEMSVLKKPFGPADFQCVCDACRGRSVEVLN